MRRLPVIIASGLAGMMLIAGGTGASGAVHSQWYPSGYTQVKDGFAVKWLANTSDPCTSKCWYYTLGVVARNGCPTQAYVQVRLVKHGRTVGHAHDSIPGLQPKQRGVMQFITRATSLRGATAIVNRVVCR